jgi:hypothetical protein
MSGIEKARINALWPSWARSGRCRAFKSAARQHVRIKGQAVAMIGERLLPWFNFLFVGGLAITAAIRAVLLSLFLRSVGASGWGAGR